MYTQVLNNPYYTFHPFYITWNTREPQKENTRRKKN